MKTFSERRNAANTARHASGGRRRRPGYVLIIVLGLAVVSFSAGTAYLDAHSSVLPEAVNREAASRAKYLAGSGVEAACHYLMQPPTTVAAGDYWRGVNGFKIDTGDDYIDVEVRQHDSKSDVFLIDSFGYAFDLDGKARAKFGVRCRVMIPESAKISIPYAILCAGSLTAAPTVEINGDVHAQSDIQISGPCTSNVSSSGVITWLSGSTPASLTEYAPSVPTPLNDASLYSTYTLNGVEYTARQQLLDYMGPVEAMATNGILDTTMDTNPGRVVVTPPGADFTMYDGANFRGTLIVGRQLQFQDGITPGTPPVTITPEADFPAVIADHHLEVDGDDLTIEINGPVVCNHLDFFNSWNVMFTINGALVTTNNDAIMKLRSTSSVILNHDPNRSSYYDFGTGVNKLPITVLDWQEY